MGNKGLSDKEAELLAAARREAGRAGRGTRRCEACGARRNCSRAPQVPRAAKNPVAPPSTNDPGYAAPAAPPPRPDSAARMAMLLEAERQASESRKRRIKRNYLIALSLVIVPAFAYALVNLFRLLAG